MNSTWLVGTLIGALIAAGATTAVALTRFARRSPESRQQDTNAFTATTTAQSALNKNQADWIVYLNGQLTLALERIEALEQSDRAKDLTIAQQNQTIASQAHRIDELEAELAGRTPPKPDLKET